MSTHYRELALGPTSYAELPFEAQEIRAGRTPPLRELQLEANEPAAILAQGQTQTGEIGNQILDLLRQYQKYGKQTAQAGEQEQIRRVFSTQENLIGASPTLQSSVRQAGVQAIQPQIGGARALIEEAERAISSYQKVQTEQQEQLRNSLKLAAGAGSQALRGLLKTNSQAFKAAGLEPESFIAGIEAQEQAIKQQQEFENKLALYRSRPSGGTPTGEPAIILRKGVPVDTSTGRPTKLAEGDKKLLDAFNKIDNTINQLEQVYSKAQVKTGFAPLTRLLGRGKQIGQKLGLTSAAVREYEALVNASVGPIARAVLGEVGVLTDKDVERAKGALPSLTDTPEESRRKIANMRQIVKENRSDFFDRLGVESESANEWEYIL